jgi:hypothetical protein
LSAVLAGGCSQKADAVPEQRRSPPSVGALAVRQGVAPLVLSAYASGDRFRLNDTIAFIYLIQNFGASTQLRLDPRFFELTVIDASGKPVEMQVAQWHGSTGNASTLLLPTGGVVGRAFNLTCAQLGVSSQDACDREFKLTAPGQYRAVVRFAPVPPPGEGAQSIPALTSDTIRFTLVPR